MPQKKRFSVRDGYCVKAKVTSMWEWRFAGRRINESNTDNGVKLFFYSTSCLIISTALMSCQGLWLRDNCVHFSHWADSKGLLFCNNAIFLSRRCRCSHAHHTNTHTVNMHNTNFLMLHYAPAHIAHIFRAHVHRNTYIAVKTQFPRIWLHGYIAYTLAHLHTYDYIWCL